MEASSPAATRSGNFQLPFENPLLSLPNMISFETTQGLFLVRSTINCSTQSGCCSFHRRISGPAGSLKRSDQSRSKIQQLIIVPTIMRRS